MIQPGATPHTWTQSNGRISLPKLPSRKPHHIPKLVKVQLRKYVQDRLAGEIAGPGGAAVRGPVVP